MSCGHDKRIACGWPLANLVFFLCISLSFWVVSINRGFGYPSRYVTIWILEHNEVLTRAAGIEPATLGIRFKLASHYKEDHCFVWLDKTIIITEHFFLTALGEQLNLKAVDRKIFISPPVIALVLTNPERQMVKPGFGLLYPKYRFTLEELWVRGASPSTLHLLLSLPSLEGTWSMGFGLEASQRG